MLVLLLLVAGGAAYYMGNDPSTPAKPNPAQGGPATTQPSAGSAAKVAAATTQPSGRVIQLVEAIVARDEAAARRAMKSVDVNDTEVRSAVATTTIDATYRGDVETLKLIRQLGFGMDCVDAMGRQPIHLAATTDTSPTVLEFLVNEAGIKVDSAVPVTGETPLMLAVAGNRLGAISKLVDLRTDHQAKDQMGQTALHIAAARDRLDATRLLFTLVPRLDPNALDNRNRTPLHVAAKEGYADMALLLIVQGADANRTDADGKYPATLAMEYLDKDAAAKIIKAIGRPPVER